MFQKETMPVYYDPANNGHPYSPILEGQHDITYLSTEYKPNSEIMLAGHPLLKYPFKPETIEEFPFQNGTYSFVDQHEQTVIYTQQTTRLQGSGVHLMLTRTQKSSGTIDGYTVFYQDEYDPNVYHQDFHGHQKLLAEFTKNPNTPTVQILNHLAENISRPQLEANPRNSQVLAGHIWAQYRIYSRDNSQHSQDLTNFISQKTAETLLNLTHDNQTALTALSAIHQILNDTYNQWNHEECASTARRTFDTHNEVYEIFRTLVNGLQDDYSDVVSYLSHIVHMDYITNVGPSLPPKDAYKDLDWDILEKATEED